MVHSVIRMVMSPKKRIESQRILMSLVEKTRVEQGCISCYLYQCIEDEQVIMIEGLWQSQEDLNRHLCADDYLKVLLVLEMAIVKPEIKFYCISSSTGFETIEKARSTLHGHLGCQ
jgi:quinol monooxygenase YgiN